MRESFIFYKSFYDSLKGMDEKTQGKCLMALADYALNGNEPSCEPEVMMFFILAKPQIDANNQRYENGCKGGRPKNQTETKTKPKYNQKETKDEPNDNVNDNDNVNVKEKEIDKEKVAIASLRFQKPTVEQVRSYSKQQGYVLDEQAFWDFYESKGWKVGNQPMKDWQAAVRNWVRKDKQRFGYDNTKSRQKIAFEKAYNNLQALYEDDVLEVANAG